MRNNLLQNTDNKLRNIAGSDLNYVAYSRYDANARRLTLGETKLLRNAFGNSIDLSNVRIVNGAGKNLDAIAAFNLAGKPAITEGNTVYINPAVKNGTSKYYSADFSSSSNGTSTLLHEFTHVLQFQRLGFSGFEIKYATDFANNDFNNAKVYDYLSRNTTFLTETLEGQAQMVGDYARYKSQNIPSSTPEMQSLEKKLKGSGIYGF